MLQLTKETEQEKDNRQTQTQGKRQSRSPIQIKQYNQNSTPKSCKWPLGGVQMHLTETK